MEKRQLVAKLASRYSCHVSCIKAECDKVVVFQFVTNDYQKRDKYWKLIRDMPRQRVADGLKEWDYHSSKLYFTAILEYYGQRDDDPEVIKCFEHLVNMGMLGYWTKGREEQAKPLLDFHGYGFEQTRFMVHYLMDIKWREIVEKVGYQWVIVTGNRYHAAPEKVASKKSGIKEYIMDILKTEYGIRCKEKQGNRGRIIVNVQDLKRVLDGKRNEQPNALKIEDFDQVTDGKDTDSVIEEESSVQKQNISDQNEDISLERLQMMTCAELKERLKECALKVSGRKAELIERLRQHHQINTNTS